MVASATHNSWAAVFLLLTVGAPLLWLIFGSMAGSFDGRQNRKVKSREIPKRKVERVYEENPLHQTNEIKHHMCG